MKRYTTSLTANIADVSAAFRWVADVKAKEITLSIDPTTGTAEIRHTSSMDEPTPGYHEHPIRNAQITGERKVSAHLPFPDQLKYALKCATLAQEEECTITATLTVSDTGGTKIESVRLTAGKHNSSPLDVSTLSRTPKPKMVTVGSVPTQNINNGIRVARSIKHREDITGLFVVFKLNNETSQLEILTSSTIPANAVALIYSAPFQGMVTESEDVVDFKNQLAAGLAILPETRSFTGEHVELVLADNLFGFRDTETGAVALYSTRAVAPDAIPTFRKFFTKLRNLKLEQTYEMNLAVLKEALLTMASASATSNITQATLNFQKEGDVLLHLDTWTTELDAKVTSDTSVPLEVVGDYRTLIQFVTARTSAVGNIGFLPQPSTDEAKNYAIQTTPDGAGELLVVSRCISVTPQEQ